MTSAELQRVAPSIPRSWRPSNRATRGKINEEGCERRAEYSPVAATRAVAVAWWSLSVTCHQRASAVSAQRTTPRSRSMTRKTLSLESTSNRRIHRIVACPRFAGSAQSRSNAALYRVAELSSCASRRTPIGRRGARPESWDVVAADDRWLREPLAALRGPPWTGRGWSRDRRDRHRAQVGRTSSRVSTSTGRALSRMRHMDRAPQSEGRLSPATVFGESRKLGSGRSGQIAASRAARVRRRSRSRAPATTAARLRPAPVSTSPVDKLDKVVR